LPSSSSALDGGGVSAAASAVEVVEDDDISLLFQVIASCLRREACRVKSEVYKHRIVIRVNVRKGFACVLWWCVCVLLCVLVLYRLCRVVVCVHQV
jgi:hypothetical protein